MNKEFEFDNYFSKTLSEWPEKVNCTEIDIYSNEMFIVKALPNLSDEISEKYINHPDELIMRSMHQFISVAIHDAARYLNVVFLGDLRSDFIKHKVSDHLKYILETGAGNWDRAEDKAFINSYLAENS